MVVGDASCIRYSPSPAKAGSGTKRPASLPSPERCHLGTGRRAARSCVATVIPAPITNVNFVAVKTLVVETPASSTRLPVKTGDEEMICFLEQAFTMNKIECSRQAIA